MEKQRHGKSYAREHAIKSLYTYNLKPNSDAYLSDDKMGNELTNGVIEHQDELDERIKKYLRKWTITQLNPVDLAILRLSVYELTYLETPAAVVVNEALEFAKKYSDEPSKKFIHRVLDNIIKE